MEATGRQRNREFERKEVNDKQEGMGRGKASTKSTSARRQHGDNGTSLQHHALTDTRADSICIKAAALSCAPHQVRCDNGVTRISHPSRQKKPANCQLMKVTRLQVLT